MSEKITFVIGVEGTTEIQQNFKEMAGNVEQLTRQIKANKAAMDTLVKANKTNTDEYKKLALSNKLLADEKKDLNQTLKQELAVNQSVKGSLSAVNAEVNKLRREIRLQDLGTQEYLKTASRIKELEQIQRQHNVEMGRGKFFVGEYGKAFVDSFAKMAVAVVGVQAVVGQIEQFVGGSVDAFIAQEKASEQARIVFGDFSKQLEQTASDFQKISIY